MKPEQRIGRIWACSIVVFVSLSGWYGRRLRGQSHSCAALKPCEHCFEDSVSSERLNCAFLPEAMMGHTILTQDWALLRITRQGGALLTNPFFLSATVSMGHGA